VDRSKFVTLETISIALLKLTATQRPGDAGWQGVDAGSDS
jgi:hypothetical protein